MYILLIPAIIVLLIIAGIFFLSVRRWWIAGLLMVAALVVNQLTDVFALHPFTSSLSAEHPTDARTLRVLTYNIGLHNDYLDHNQDQLQGIAQLFSQTDADVVVLPESRLYSRYPRLLELLSQQYPYNITQATDITPRYIETFVFSRYPISNVQQLGDYIYAMDVTPDLAMPSLRLVACHLSSNQWHSSLNGGEGLLGNLQQGYARRLEQAQSIVTSLSGHQGPLIVCGDLNDLCGSPALRTLQQQLSLSDVWSAKGFGYGTTCTAKGLRLRLDHILYNPKQLTATSVAICDAPFSDHLPLAADFRY